MIVLTHTSCSWFESRSNIWSCSVIIQVRVVLLRRTTVDCGDWFFYNPSRSYHHSQVMTCLLSQSCKFDWCNSPVDRTEAPNFKMDQNWAISTVYNYLSLSITSWQNWPIPASYCFLLLLIFYVLFSWCGSHQALPIPASVRRQSIFRTSAGSWTTARKSHIHIYFVCSL